MKKTVRRFGTFILYAGPAMFFFTMTVIVPLIYGIYLTFTDWDGISKEKKLIGMQNYLTAFSDGKFWNSLLLTVVFTAVSVFLVNYIAFLIARLVTEKIRFRNLFRASFFTPNLIGGVVLGYIWQFIFGRAVVAVGKSTGIRFLSKSMLSGTVTAMAAMVIVTVWQYSGYMMLIYIAGLMNIPNELIDAGKIDGCTNRQCRKYIVMPLMISSFIICIFLTITRCFMTYDLNFALTEGNPFGSTVMASMFVYRKAFSEKNYGLGQTEAMLLFAVCAAVALFQVFVTKRKEIEA